MPYDIYGEHLRPGHCEVHPDVHEEYPCSYCMGESSRKQQEMREWETKYYAEYYAEMIRLHEEEIFLEGAYYGA